MMDQDEKIFRKLAFLLNSDHNREGVLPFNFNRASISAEHTAFDLVFSTEVIHSVGQSRQQQHDIKIEGY
jgi:hypothetical protein